MYTVPSSSPASYSGTTLGWSSAATMRASRRRRSRIDGVARDLGLDQLERDGPVEPHLAGAVEDPDPAGADDALDLVSGKGGAGSEHRSRGRARRSGRRRMPVRPGARASRSGASCSTPSFAYSTLRWVFTSPATGTAPRRSARSVAGLANPSCPVRTAQRHQHAALGAREARRAGASRPAPAATPALRLRVRRSAASGT